LESVVEEACRTSKIARDSADAENMALKIMLLFQSGVDDRGQLLEAAIALPDADEVQAGLAMQLSPQALPLEHVLQQP
jgi:hypothetical protein